MTPSEVREIVELAGVTPAQFARALEFQERVFRYYLAGRHDQVQRECYRMVRDEDGAWHVPLYLEFALRWIRQELRAGRNPVEPDQVDS